MQKPLLHIEQQYSARYHFNSLHFGSTVLSHYVIMGLQ